jgi:hypothetical protein
MHGINIKKINVQHFFVFIYLYLLYGLNHIAEAYGGHYMKNSYKTLVRKPHWRKLLLAPTEVNAERGFKNYHLAHDWACSHKRARRRNQTSFE